MMNISVRQNIYNVIPAFHLIRSPNADFRFLVPATSSLRPATLMIPIDKQSNKCNTIYKLSINPPILDSSPTRIPVATLSPISNLFSSFTSILNNSKVIEPFSTIYNDIKGEQFEIKFSFSDDHPINSKISQSEAPTNLKFSSSDFSAKIRNQSNSKIINLPPIQKNIKENQTPQRIIQNKIEVDKLKENHMKILMKLDSENSLIVHSEENLLSKKKNQDFGQLSDSIIDKNLSAISDNQSILFISNHSLSSTTGSSTIFESLNSKSSVKADKQNDPSSTKFKIDNNVALTNISTTSTRKSTRILHRSVISNTQFKLKSNNNSNSQSISAFSNYSHLSAIKNLRNFQNKRRIQKTPTEQDHREKERIRRRKVREMETPQKREERCRKRREAERKRRETWTPEQWEIYRSKCRNLRLKTLEKCKKKEK